MENFHCDEKDEEAEKMEKLALAWIEKNMYRQEWPEDDWIALGDDGEYDLNLWLSDDTPDYPGLWGATVYRVFDGSTDTGTGVSVPLAKLSFHWSPS